jgi:hypothetical protein
MTRMTFTLAPLAAILALACGSAQAARPSQDEIDQARSACHANKEKVASLEQRLSYGDRQLTSAFRTWEASCAHAQALMDQRDGKPVLVAEGLLADQTPARTAYNEYGPRSDATMIQVPVRADDYTATYPDESSATPLTCDADH